MGNRDGWELYEKLVLSELERLSENVSDLAAALQDLKVDTVSDLKLLKFQAGIWGGLAGSVPAIIAIIWSLMEN